MQHDAAVQRRTPGRRLERETSDSTRRRPTRRAGARTLEALVWRASSSRLGQEERERSAGSLCRAGIHTPRVALATRGRPVLKTARRHGMRVLAMLIAFTVAAAAQSKPFKFPESPIDPGRLAAHVRTLASDAFEGRAPASAGETKTLDYITKQLTAAGVKPGGDPDGQGGRRWTQDVPLAQSDIQGAVAANFRFGEDVRLLRQGDEVAFRSPFLPTSRVSIDRAPLVFVGYGVTAPERSWDDFKGTDLRGKIGVVLINDPDFEADLGGKFDGKAMTYYGRWTYKYEEAARRGALGMLVVHETAPASYGWETVKNSNTATMFDIVRANPAETGLMMEGWVQREVAGDLFRRAGLDFETEKKKAQSASFKPVPLGNATFSADYSVRQ